MYLIRFFLYILASPEAWRHEAAHVDNIYATSYCSIAATEAVKEIKHVSSSGTSLRYLHALLGLVTANRDQTEHFNDAYMRMQRGLFVCVRVAREAQIQLRVSLKEVAIQCLVWPHVEPEVIDSINKSIQCGIYSRTDLARCLNPKAVL